MDLYFSHSYRDVSINSYFVNELAGSGFVLKADQKSPVWCVAKLERYITEFPGFLSVIPRRLTDDGAIACSPYIAHELSLARRSGVPRLLFVDDQVLAKNRSLFPADAVPFVADAPARDRMRHAQQIRTFKDRLEEQASRPPRSFVDRQATLVAAGGTVIGEAADTVADVLVANGFDVKMVRGKRALAGFEDIALFERLISSELCVFLLDTKISPADVMMGMAHAHSIPSIRLQYDKAATQCEPTLSGRLPWARTSDLVGEFTKQLEWFRRGFVEAVTAETVLAIGTTKWPVTPQHLWAFDDPPSLRSHVVPLHPWVLDQVVRVNQEHGTTLASRSGGGQDLDICMAVFRELRQLHFVYEFEPQNPSPGQQAIRAPGDILNSHGATCIDVACLFGSLLMAAGLKPLIVLLDQGRYGHALAGYRASTARPWTKVPDLDDLRNAVHRQDVVLFEATGVVESEKAVGAETDEERHKGGRTLDFMTARQAAERMIQGDVRLRAAVDLSARK